jgi:hypothetical protein
MMTPDRRAKMVELAEAMALVNRCSVATKILRHHFQRDMVYQETMTAAEAELTAAAERLDKAMWAWMKESFWNMPVQVCTGGGYVDPNKIESANPDRE